MKLLTNITSLIVCICLAVCIASTNSKAQELTPEEGALMGILGHIIKEGLKEDAKYYDGKTTDGGHYRGSIKDRRPHGHGEYNFPDGDIYIGEFYDGKRHGSGTYTWANGQKYSGEWQYGWRHGQGTETYPDGNKYIGEFQDDKKNGEGTFIWADGKKYVGEFKDGKMHGQGTYTWADGDKYIGELQDSKKHGQGTYTWADGRKYVGGWQDDKKHGQGTFTTKDGNRYEGEWVEDSIFGEIVKTDTNNVKAYYTKTQDGKLSEDYEKNTASYTAALKQYPENTTYLNGLAWYMATAPDPSLRNGKRAVTLALKAVSLEKDEVRHLEFLDTLAAAYAEAGDFVKAVETEEKVIALLIEQSKEEKVPSFEERLDSYKAGKPWRIE
jgi:hypothetical protein